MLTSGTNVLHAMALAVREAPGDDTPTSTILEAAVATAVAVAAAATKTDSSDEAPEGECRLMGPFALLVQLALGGLALLSLVFKRWRERPQRPLKIWFFDASKQVFGSVLVHIANVFMSLLTSGRFSVKIEPGVVATAGQTVRRLMAREDEPYTPNPCSFYLLNLAIDTTLGIPILIFLLRITTGLVALTPMGKPAESIQSGYYGNPPRAWWWLKQSLIYFIGLMGMKLVVLVIFLVLPWISKVGDWALGWTEGNEKLQIAFVMMIFPLIMNAMQYYIIDSFIKKKESEATVDAEHERVPGEDPDERRAFGADVEGGEELLTGSTSDDEDDDRDRDGRAGPKGAKNHRLSLGGEDEYDPDKDGEAPTVIGSTSSSKKLQRSSVKVADPQLLPKE